MSDYKYHFKKKTAAHFSDEANVYRPSTNSRRLVAMLTFRPSPDIFFYKNISSVFLRRIIVDIET